MKNKILLILIILLAFFLRVWRLGEMPPSLTWDEAALGYNAYSVLKTGRDEYGRFLPLIFKSFGDYKPGLYVYLTIPFVWLFGLTELAVRLPSAILGVLGILGVYLLVKGLFGNSSTSQDVRQLAEQPPRFLFGSHTGRTSAGKTLRVKNSKPEGLGNAEVEELALFAALLLAISPWHINFSRGAWEANAALSFVLAGVVVFLRVFREFGGFKYLVFSSLFFVFSLYTYQTAKLFVPLLVLGLFLIYRKEILKLSKRQILVVLLPFLLVVSLYLGALDKTGGRLKVMSVFSNPRPRSDIEDILVQDKTTENSLVFKLFHNESLNFARGILGRYFNHFSGRFLFFEGDWQNPRLGVPYMGMLYFVDLIFVLLGFAALAQTEGKSKYLILWWFLIAPIPAALSRDAVSSVRALSMVIPLVIFISLGFFGTLGFLKSKRKKILVVSLLVIIYSWHLVYYLDQYYVHRPKKYSQTMQFGYKEVVNLIYPEFSRKYERIIFTQYYGQPYIYWLFYTRYDPAEYQKQAHLIESPVGDVGRVERINNIEFREIYWPADRGFKNSLFIGTEWELPLKDIEPVQARVLEEINFLNGQLAFRIVET